MHLRQKEVMKHSGCSTTGSPRTVVGGAPAGLGAAAGGVLGVQRGFVRAVVGIVVGAAVGFFAIFGAGAGGETGFCSIVSCRFATTSGTGSVIRAEMPDDEREFAICR